MGGCGGAKTNVFFRDPRIGRLTLLYLKPKKSHEISIMNMLIAGDGLYAEEAPKLIHCSICMYRSGGISLDLIF